MNMLVSWKINASKKKKKINKILQSLICALCSTL